jgi:hypothetical protein
MPFDAATADEAFARQCFRVLRRTCGRYFVAFTYYTESRSDTHVNFVLVFDGHPSQLGLASADFALEMRAVALVEPDVRRKRLALRLLHWITFSGSDALLIIPDGSSVPAGQRALVLQHITEYVLAWGAWRRNHLQAPDFLEAMHSFITNLALAIGDGVDTTTKYPKLVQSLRAPELLEAQLKTLGVARNRVKHRGKRHQAQRAAEDHEQAVYSAMHYLTGVVAMPRTPHMLAWESDPRTVLRQPPTFDRWGNPKKHTRY